MNKKRLFLTILLASFLLISNTAFGRGGHYGGGQRSYLGGHTSRYTYGVPRDSKGRIKRSESAKKEFMKGTGYPHGRTGYVVDHVIPLKRGGADSPSNMQWQTKEAAKAKDRIE